MPLLDFAHVRNGALHETVVDGPLHQGTAGAGADLALVQREHGKALEALVEEIVVLIHDVGEEDVRRLPRRVQASPE